MDSNGELGCCVDVDKVHSVEDNARTVGRTAGENAVSFQAVKMSIKAHIQLQVM